jgi:hypothetical protein
MKNKQTYYLICFADLAYEFDATQKKKVEAKIRRRLNYYALGEYDQEKVDYIRELKDELRNEITSAATSKFYKDQGTGLQS